MIQATRINHPDQSRCKACNVKCLPIRELFNETLCFACYEAARSLLRQKWTEKVGRYYDSNATVDVRDGGTVIVLEHGHKGGSL